MSDWRRVAAVVGAVVLLLLGSAVHSLSQTEQKDRSDAVRVARQIVRDLQKSQDVSSIIRKYAVKDFLDGAIDDHLFNVFGAVDDSVIPKLDPKTRNDYYVAATNWLYLGIIYSSTQKRKKNAYGGEDLVLPPGIEKLMKGKPILSNWLPESDQDMPKPKTVEAVENAVTNIEAVNVVYRRYLRHVKQMSFKKYYSILEKADGRGKDFFTTEVSKCDETYSKCRNVPTGSRMIGVMVPGFYFVDFARVNGNMKILHIYQGPGD